MKYELGMRFYPKKSYKEIYHPDECYILLRNGATVGVWSTRQNGWHMGDFGRGMGEDVDASLYDLYDIVSGKSHHWKEFYAKIT
jgi:hypothetical protein